MTVRGFENVTKRYLVHAVVYNLGLLMRALFGNGQRHPERDGRCLGTPYFCTYGSVDGHFHANIGSSPQFATCLASKNGCGDRAGHRMISLGRDGDFQRTVNQLNLFVE